MNDTDPETAELQHRLLMSRPGSERLLMSGRMFDAARELVLASFPPGLSIDETRRRLFFRFYADLPLADVPEALREGR